MTIVENEFSHREDDTRKRGGRETFSRSLSIVFRCSDDCLHANSVEKERVLHRLSPFLLPFFPPSWRWNSGLPFDGR